MIELNSMILQLKKAYTNPLFGCKTVYSNSVFNYVELWLRQKGNEYKEGLYYWVQAKAFYESTLSLPMSAKPLTAYYCCMNAAKALLAIRGENLVNISHGVSSASATRSKIFRNNKIILSPSGVFGKLAQSYGLNLGGKYTYSVYDMMYNIPCVHRAFSLSFKDAVELFVPVKFKGFDYGGDKKIFFIFAVPKKYATGNALRYNINTSIFEYIPDKFYTDDTDRNKYCYYRTKRKKMIWDIHTPLKGEGGRLEQLTAYYKNIRPYFYNINDNQNLWYIRKILPKAETIDLPPTLLILAVMHWLSELVRYSPNIFTAFMADKTNWLLNEFIDAGLNQFIDDISSEITGADIVLQRGL